MTVKGINQIHVSVDDIEAAITFYRDVLGLDFLFDVPEQSMAFFDVDGVRLYLGRPESAEFQSAPLVYFAVEDIDAEYLRLESNDVEFVDAPHKVHATDDYELWMAFFKTPAGHINALAEERSLT